MCSQRLGMLWMQQNYQGILTVGFYAVHSSWRHFITSPSLSTNASTPHAESSGGEQHALCVCYHGEPSPTTDGEGGWTLGCAGWGAVAVWHHGVIGPCRFVSTVSLTGPIRVQRVPLTDRRARGHIDLQGPHCPYLLWVTVKETRW